MSDVLAGLRLAHPVMVASGCGGTGRELAPYVDLDGLAFVTRTLTREPHPGSAMPRVLESPSGLLHAVGLHNPGIEVFLSDELPWLVRAGARVLVSFCATSLGEYAELTRLLAGAPGLGGVEVNLASPDADAVGAFDAREPFHAASAVAAVRRELPADLALLVKVRPDPVRVVETARAVRDAGAGAVVVGGALAAAMPDGRPAGLSGPAIRPVTLAATRAVRRAAPEVPVVACGGVTAPEHVRAYLDAGAVAVQVGTGLLHDPTLITRLAHDLEETP
ncbi:tRNA-dihydrouridine synthase [Nocardioides daphniae]|uniref:Dihydroorotate dehydrogenase n=1 Tax=Nocardioides daphniae TaxID=402297 RepID=A0A4V1CWF9_9ACTN|nr:tRNA-dihydrouridine synthase [Nocardioides daphniae]QCC77127.1 dihydroorotate dehydrogenase [Nocardioides daphniae]GGD19865.1 dihydroorotate dehydrogenase [Nocardioides daphniae]